tara:strand:- start:1666 stop:2193 length:528 start_codon:yes stop_codon:yes gene_type:complete
MYFDKFPLFVYDGRGDGELTVVTNLLKRVAMRTKVRAETLLFDTYDVKEGESPESIAFKLYGDTEYQWIVLLFNNITDRYHQWPLTTPQFLQFVNDKYDNPNDTHHYEINQTSGDTTVKINIGTDNTDFPSATPITNIEYEQERQDEIRQIRLLDPTYVEQVTDEFEKLIKQSIV